MTSTQTDSLSSSLAERIGVALLCAALLLGGAAAWWVRLQPPLFLDVGPLAALPTQVGTWRAEDIPIEDEVADELDADFNIQRDYRHSTGARAWVYIGYYSTARGGRPEHTPRACYTGAGWALLSTGDREVDGGRAQIREFEVERAGQRRLVHFWYRTHRRGGLTGGLDLSIDRVIGRLTSGRADAALVRISTALRPGEDLTAARSRLDSLRTALDPQLAHHWPTEGSSAVQPAGNQGAGALYPMGEIAPDVRAREPAAVDFSRSIGKGSSPADVKAAHTARGFTPGVPLVGRLRSHGLSSDRTANLLMGR